MRRNSFLIGWIVLIAGLLCSMRGGAVDVNSAEALISAVNNGTSYIKLTKNIELGNSTLTIFSGTITLDLNGKTLSATRMSNGAATCISVNGGNLIITGGGTISATAKGTTEGVWGSGKNGYDGIALSYNGGSVAIRNATFKAIATNGAGIISGSNGTAYTLDPNNGYTVDNMIPAGAYMTNSSDYGSTGLVSSSITVVLTQYNVSYNPDGGTPQPENGIYTIETSDFFLPTVTKNGYTFGGWKYNGNMVNTTALPTTTERAGNVSMTFDATWNVISYKVVYDVDGGVALPDGSYNIETALTSLPTPQREGYVFDGWYRGNQKVTSIPAGTGDVTLKAHWTEISYTLSFKTNNGTSLADISYTKTQPGTLPSGLTKEGYMFGGWFLDENFTGSKLEAVPFPAGTAGQTNIPVMVYAKWTPTPYTITFNTNGGSDQDALRYTIETETFKLPTRTTKAGYTLVGWYIDEDLTKSYGEVVKGTHGDFTLYAKWELAQYTIEYELYGYGNNPPDAVTCYNIEKEVKLPTPQRENFTFVGWHKDDLLKDQALMIIPAGTTGNLKLYAEWTMGNSVQISRPANGTITVKSGSTEVKPGDKVGANTSLTITATPASADYKLSKLVVNNIEYTNSPQTVVMPAEGGLTISAVFTDPRPAASAPKVTTDPVNTDYIPSGEPVTVTMEKNGECDSLLYSIDGSTPKLYTGAFQVSTITTATKTVAVQAIARKSGCKDGVTTRNITFRSGKITITFNLPKGITASNPAGGEVVEAVASGGAFEFKLIVDKNYFQTLDSIKVTANGTVITPDIYGIYTLSNQTSDVIVNVSGISGVTHLITLVQSANGMIAFTGDEDAENSRNVNHGDPVSVTAMADENYKFQSWTDGETANPRTFMAESDVTLQARFVKDSAGFSVILPELEGVTVKPLTGYSTEVKPGGKFKFYLRLEADYNESVPVVYANNEKLNVNQEVYSIYDISENIRISVDGIVRNKVKPVLQEHVSAIDVETGSDVSGLSLFTAAMIVLQADAPEGQVFSKWNDGKADNPRIVTAADASQLFPLFLPKTGQDAVCVKLPVLAGAGMGAVNANAAVVAKGESVQLKLVVLPSYSQSDVKVFANGKELDAALSLRASSETKTLFYTLSDVSEDMMVDVSGLKLNEYVVSLEQQEGGTVKASQVGMLKHGTVITLTATPNKGNMFMKWGDGNTLNPYQYVVTDNCTLKGAFAASNMSVGNENVSIPAVRIYAAGGSLHILSPEISELFVWSLEGKLIKKAGVPAGYSSYLLPAGMYVVKVGNGESVKIVIR
ncbi:InlB B-repeat-containing protein [Parabacteroides johnsonii]|uniref:InlB B-repeat-containing protein n=1 Tax=Parabacteroides johnsonii TaxID=387661 RepID=UPI00266D7E83|nr:InlB B-repeat-containing protein [Parabacteroides johnsonii]